MAVRIVVDASTRTVYSTFSGTLTVVDFLEGRDQVTKNAAFRPTFAHVLDFRAITSVDVEPSTLRDLAAMPSIFEEDGVQIIVAEPASPVFAMAQLFKTLATGSGRNMRIAETLDEARALVIAFG